MESAGVVTVESVRVTKYSNRIYLRGCRSGCRDSQDDHFVCSVLERGAEVRIGPGWRISRFRNNEARKAQLLRWPMRGHTFPRKRLCNGVCVLASVRTAHPRVLYRVVFFGGPRYRSRPVGFPVSLFMPSLTTCRPEQSEGPVQSPESCIGPSGRKRRGPQDDKPSAQKRRLTPARKTGRTATALPPAAPSR